MNSLSARVGHFAQGAAITRLFQAVRAQNPRKSRHSLFFSLLAGNSVRRERRDARHPRVCSVERAAPEPAMFANGLIPNHWEIACRIIRTARRMGIPAQV